MPSPAAKRAAKGAPKPPEETSETMKGRKKPAADEQSVAVIHSDYEKKGSAEDEQASLSKAAAVVREAAKEVEAAANKRCVILNACSHCIVQVVIVNFLFYLYKGLC